MQPWRQTLIRFGGWPSGQLRDPNPTFVARILRETQPIDHYGASAGTPIPKAVGLSRFPPQPCPIVRGNSLFPFLPSRIAPSGTTLLVASCHRATSNLQARATIMRRRLRPWPSLVRSLYQRVRLLQGWKRSQRQAIWIRCLRTREGPDVVMPGS